MEWFVALRYLRGKRKIGWISLITYISTAGVCLGTFVLVVALSVANGFEKEVRDRIVGTLAHAKILQYHNRPINNYDSLEQVIRSCPGVVAAAPYIYGKGGIDCDQVQEGIIIMGVDAGREVEVTEVGGKIVYGDFALDSIESRRERKFPGVVIGLGLADKLGVRPGREVVLMSLTLVEGEIEPAPRMGRFVVAGVFETGMYEYDLNLVYISIESARNLFGIKGVEGIQIRTTDLFRAGKIAAKVVDRLGGYPYHSIDWQAQNKSLFQWMKLEKLIIFFVISLIILIAAFNIISSLLMMILEKRREIGILMSMGATSGAIMRVFMYNGIVIGLLGSTVGTAVGVLLCFIQYRWRLIPLPGEIYFIDKVPVLLKVADVAAVYFSANIICWLATLYPAWKASKVLPAESIRFE